MTEKICKWCKWLAQPFSWLMGLAGFIFNLRFLSSRTRKWLFVEGTRPLELLNVCLLFAWGLAVWHSEGVEVLNHFGGFAYTPYPVVATIFMGLGLAILVCLPQRSHRWNVLSGFFIEGAALLWALVGFAFWYSYPPINAQMLFYPALALVNWWAGEVLIEAAKGNLPLQKEE